MKFKLLIKNKFISTFIGTFFVYLGIAFIMPINSISVYITSYIHLKQDYVTMHYGLFLHLLARISNSISYPLGGIIEHKIGFLYTISAGLVIVFIGNLIFIFQQNIWISYLLFIIMGLGSGAASSLLVKNLTFYFPHKKGIISGTCGLFSNIIGAIFSFVGEKVIAFKGYTLKDNDEFYPKEIAERVVIYFIISAVLLPIALIISNLLLYQYNPKENEKKEDNTPNEENKEDKENNINKQASGNQKDDKFEFDPNELYQKELKEKSKKNTIKALKSLRFWKTNLFFFCFLFSFTFILDTGRTIGALIGIDGTALQYISIFQSIFLIILIPLIGILADKKNPILVLRIASIIIIIPPIVLTFFMSNTFFFIISLVFDKVAFSGLLVGFITFMMEIFGIQESVVLAGIILSFGKVAEIITTSTAFAVSNFYGKEELYKPYKVIYIICFFMCIVSNVLIFLEKKEKFNYNDENTGEEKENITSEIIPDNSTHSFESDDNENDKI